MNIHKTFNSVLIFVFIFSLVSMPTLALAQEPNPRIFVEPNEDNVYAWGWPDGTLLTLTIEDTVTSQTPDYVTTQIAVAAEDWKDGFRLGGIFDIKPGHIVTVSGGNFTKQHIVTSLTVTAINIYADTVSGIGIPGSYVHVGTVCDETGCANRNITVDENGNWFADFSTPEINNPDNGRIFDIRPGSGSSAFELDADNDSTKVNWSVLNPIIGVDVDIDRVQGWDWPLGATVNFEIDDPSTPDHADYTYTTIAPVSDWNPNLIWFEFRTENYDLQPGDIVTATDGNTTKQLIVTSFRITNADLDLDIVYGIANPDQNVRIWTYNQNNTISRLVKADEDGNWSANFAIPGDEASEQETVDIRNGTSFDSFVEDEDGDNTRCMWDVPNPIIGVRVNENRVEGWGWTLGSTVTITVDDPATVISPDISKTAIVYEADWNPGEYRFDVRLNGEFEIKPGDFVKVTNGITTKTHTVTSLVFTEINIDTNTVTGMAEPGSLVDVWTCDNFGCYNLPTVTTGENGVWIADFTGLYDIRPGTWVDSSQSDEDGDGTFYGKNVPSPLFMLNVSNDSSWRGLDAWNWPLGSRVTLTVNNPDTPQNPDYTEVQTMAEPTDGDHISHAMYMQDNDIEEHFEGHPGFTITLSDGIQTKTMIVPLLSITGYDLDADTITGITDPSITLDVPTCANEDCSEWIEHYVTADSEGNWIANFSTIYDLKPGDNVEPQFYDEDGDHVVLRDWSVPIEWTLKGFFQPVDMNGVYNTVKNGSTVPFKFEIFAGSIELTDIAKIKSFTYTPIACDANASSDNIETTVTGDNNLRYDTQTGQFIYNWKTPKTAGKCYRVTIITLDDSSLVAYFKLK